MMESFKLVGGPYNNKTVEVTERFNTIDAGHATDLYVFDSVAGLYNWTANAKPQAGPDDPKYVAPLPTYVADHKQHLKDYFNKNNADITTADTVHVIKDMIRMLYWLNSRLE